MSRAGRSVQREWMIDEVGRRWPGESAGLRRHIGSDLPWPQLKAYAVANLGYCRAMVGRTGAQITLRPRVVSQPTLAGTFFWVLQQPMERIAVNLAREAPPPGDWTRRVLGSKPHALGYLSREADAQHILRNAHFLSRARPLDDVAAFPPLAALLRRAVECGFRYEREAFAPLVEGPLQRRALVIAPSSDAARLTIKEWGTGYRTYSKRWLARSRGLNVEDQRDFLYASRAADGYRTAWAQCRPILEDVDARVVDEVGMLNHVRYTRIIIPMLTRGRQPRLVGASVVNPAVDVAVERFDEP